MKLYPTKEQALRTIDGIIAGYVCDMCSGTLWECTNCLANDEEEACWYLSDEAKLLGLAFIITMPASIRKSLEEEADAL